MIKGKKMEFYEYEKDELEVGMEVALPIYVKYGWSSAFRYPVWRKEVVSALTPKKTKITLESGEVVQAEKKFGRYRTGLYKYDRVMEAETHTAKAFLYVIKHRREISDAEYGKLGDVALCSVANKLFELIELIKEGNEDDSNQNHDRNAENL